MALFISLDVYKLDLFIESKWILGSLFKKLAFPLLKVLVNAGNPLAKKVFKEEISLRFARGYLSVVQHLINQSYLEYLNKEI